MEKVGINDKICPYGKFCENKLCNHKHLDFIHYKVVLKETQDLFIKICEIITFLLLPPLQKIVLGYTDLPISLSEQLTKTNFPLSKSSLASHMIEIHLKFNLLFLYDDWRFHNSFCKSCRKSITVFYKETKGFTCRSVHCINCCVSCFVRKDKLCRKYCCRLCKDTKCYCEMYIEKKMDVCKKCHKYKTTGLLSF